MNCLHKFKFNIVSCFLHSKKFFFVVILMLVGFYGFGQETPMDKYNHLMKEIKKAGKTRAEWKKMTDPVALQKLYDVQRPIYKEIKKQLKIMKKEGKDVSLLKKEAKKYTTMGMSLQIESATKDEIIRVAKAKTARARAEAERARARAKAERARAEAEAERARAEAERARAKTAQLDKLHKWLSRWKKNIYAPQAKKELKDIINAYETTYGKGSFFSDKILSPENEKNIKAILNK